MELLYQVALTFVPQVGAVNAKSLVSYCGSAKGVFDSKAKDLLKIPGIGRQTAANIASAEPLRKAETELVFMEKHQIIPLFYTDERFPVRLRQNSDAPVLLYYKGSDVQRLNTNRIVAIVGTRQPSEQGKIICEEIVEGLKPFGAIAVSGLAYGIDVTAHKKALATDLYNIGVLGHGMSKIYPDAHRSVAQKMLENGGLLTEYPHPLGPDREHFPMRNRIIAGMADALIVVETAETGGSMISAQLAAQYEREVFAVPGRPRDPKSVGCNYLIKTEQAKLLESVEDLANALGWVLDSNPRAVQKQLFLDLSPQESLIVDMVRGQPEIPVDLLTFATRLSPGELASLLLGLEFKGVLRTLPGKRYILVD